MGAIAAGAGILAAWLLYLFSWRDAAPGWTMILPLLLLLWPAEKWVKRNFTKTTIAGDRLRYETGVLSRATRTIQLSKIQDVRVEQRLGQRMFDIGDLSIETAGETSRLTLSNVDGPQALADEIMDRVQKGASV